jgi:hypothetical protein
MFIKINYEKKEKIKKKQLLHKSIFSWVEDDQNFLNMFSDSLDFIHLSKSKIKMSENCFKILKQISKMSDNTYVSLDIFEICFRILTS